MLRELSGGYAVCLGGARHGEAVEERIGRPVPFHGLDHRGAAERVVYLEYPGSGTEGDQRPAVFPAGKTDIMMLQMGVGVSFSGGCAAADGYGPSVAGVDIVHDLPEYGAVG